MYADLLIINAHALTMDPAQPQAESVAIIGDRIIGVGSNIDLAALRGPHTQLINAGGRTLMPGIIDSHFHLLWGSVQLDDMLFDGVSSYAEMMAIVHAYAAAHPDKPWLVGHGLPYNLLPGHAALTRQHLDMIIADRPLIVISFDIHTGWANTKALELAGLLHGGTCAPGNEIVIGADGLATGELREPGAYQQVTALVPKQSEAETRTLIRKGLARAARYGITSIHNMDGDARQMALYTGLEARGELTLRVSIPFLATPEMPLEALSEAIVMQDAQTTMVRSKRVKCFMDGVIESYTALMLADYVDSPGNSGVAIFSAEQFTRLVTEADRLGLQVTVHAIGDGAVRRTLDGYTYAQRINGRRDLRHRIEHIEVLNLADLPRFKELGITASMQPLHAAISAPGSVWAERVGAAAWARSFPWQTLRAAGVPLVFGSDWPVVTQNPFMSMHAALARKPWAAGQPNEAQELGDTLAAYTRDAAFAEHQETVKGQLCEGMLADLVVLSDDIAVLHIDQVKDLSAVLTICGGQLVHQAL